MFQPPANFIAMGRADFQMSNGSYFRNKAPSFTACWCGRAEAYCLSVSWLHLQQETQCVIIATGTTVWEGRGWMNNIPLGNQARNLQFRHLLEKNVLISAFGVILYACMCICERGSSGTTEISENDKCPGWWVDSSSKVMEEGGSLGVSSVCIVIGSSVSNRLPRLYFSQRHNQSASAPLPSA